MGKCKIEGCSRRVVPNYLKTPRCLKHMRFWQMQMSAKVGGKTVPTTDALETRYAELGKPMCCPHCSHRMYWLAKTNARRVVTLQHDHDGNCRLLCAVCNINHWPMPDDGFYEMPCDKKRCCRCEKIKPRSAFHAYSDGSRIYSYCRECARDYGREWFDKNREKRLDYLRKYRRVSA